MQLRELLNCSAAGGARRAPVSSVGSSYTVEHLGCKSGLASCCRRKGRQRARAFAKYGRLLTSWSPEFSAVGGGLAALSAAACAYIQAAPQRSAAAALAVRTSARPTPLLRRPSATTRLDTYALRCAPAASPPCRQALAPPRQ